MKVAFTAEQVDNKPKRNLAQTNCKLKIIEVSEKLEIKSLPSIFTKFSNDGIMYLNSSKYQP